MCYLIIVRCGQGGSKSICKDNERLARNEAFYCHGLGKNGVWRDKWLYISSSRAQRAKISSSHPQASPKVVGNGEGTRIEAMLVARFDAEVDYKFDVSPFVLKEVDARCWTILYIKFSTDVHILLSR